MAVFARGRINQDLRCAAAIATTAANAWPKALVGATQVVLVRWGAAERVSNEGEGARAARLDCD